jgi:hypothetical protein
MSVQVVAVLGWEVYAHWSLVEPCDFTEHEGVLLFERLIVKLSDEATTKARVAV